MSIQIKLHPVPCLADERALLCYLVQNLPTEPIEEATSDTAAEIITGLVDASMIAAKRAAFILTKFRRWGLWEGGADRSFGGTPTQEGRARADSLISLYVMFDNDPILELKPPAHSVARMRGCICSQEMNRDGLGIPIEQRHYGRKFLINAECPLHGTAAARKLLRQLQYEKTILLGYSARLTSPIMAT